MLQVLNQRLTKIMPIITPVSVVIGVLLSKWLGSYAFLVPWIFGFMTFAGSLRSNFKDLKTVLIKPLPLIVSMLILHVAMPFLAWGMGHLVFHNDIFTVTGLVLAMVIPTGVSSVIWVSVYRGNIPLTLAIILIDTLLSPFIVPYSMSVLAGAKIHMDVLGMMQGLWWMIVFPSLLGMLVNHFAGKQARKLETTLAPFSKIGLGVVVMINSGVIGPYLQHVNGKLVSIAGFGLAQAALGYLLGWLAAKYCRWDRETTVAMIFNTGMRNISAGAVIAIAYFPAAAAVPVVLGMLFQQLLASFYGYLIHHFYDSNNHIHTNKSAAT
ncbi:bile acid:sodium symporter family protein [Ectobacillus panaciterrae]|uniref:bile acid:sodium symporter family protein n=1 Tax=Ectobacillus panaciterrae TaxID=363872 RepID=UPI000421FF2A|nr:bile acid:sodium symporter family protein [Ectobacillus panaciterrae]